MKPKRDPHAEPGMAQKGANPSPEQCLAHRPTGRDTWMFYRIFVEERTDLSYYAVWQLAIREAARHRKAWYKYLTAQMEQQGAASPTDRAAFSQHRKQLRQSHMPSPVARPPRVWLITDDPFLPDPALLSKDVID